MPVPLEILSDARCGHITHDTCRWRHVHHRVRDWPLPFRPRAFPIAQRIRNGLARHRRLAILLGSVLLLAGILSSLVALRFGAPLLLVFLIVGMLAGKSGPGGLKFDDVRATYMVGSVALALILFDGGLRTRFATFRSVLAPSLLLATAGVLITAAITAPVARYVLDMGWIESLLVGAVVASTDAAAVFFLVHARGLRLRPRVGATLRGRIRHQRSVRRVPDCDAGPGDLRSATSRGGRLPRPSRRKQFSELSLEFAGGRIVVLSLNRLGLAQGLHAPFVAVSALVVFAFAPVAAFVRISRRLSRRARRRQPADARTIRSWCFSTR